jgi:hypothetical protein
MNEADRRKFLRTSDWHNFVQELKQQQNAQVDLYAYRKACYRDIEKLRERPILVYATKFPEAVHPAAPISIDETDVDGFTDLVESLKRQREGGRSFTQPWWFSGSH